VIKGADRGLGYATALSLWMPETDCDIILACKTEEGAEKAFGNILIGWPDAKDRLFCWVMDVTSVESVKKFIEWYKRED